MALKNNIITPHRNIIDEIVVADTNKVKTYWR